MDFPRFTGSDLEDWLFQAEEYFAFHNITDDSRVQIAGFNMTNGTLAWMCDMCRNNLLSSWDRLKEDLHKCFGASVFDDKLEELS